MKKFLRYIPSAVFFIILIVMSGIGTLIQFNFDIKQIVWVAFLISFILRFALNAMSRYIGSDTCYIIEKEKIYVQEPKERFIKLSKAIDYGTFEEWIDAENLTAKIDAYKNKITKKINRIKRKIRIITSKNTLKQKKRYTEKIKTLKERQSFLESEITDEFIKENINYLRVKFRKLKARDFESESEIENSQKETYSINVSFETFKGIVKGLPVMFFISLFGSVITYNIAMGSINTISCLYDIAMIILNASIGYVGLGKKNIQKLIGVYNSRSKVLSKYINQTPSDRSKAFKLLEALNKTEKPPESKPDTASEKK